MNSKKHFLISGFMGLLASIIVGLGEFYLHYSPQVIGNAANYHFFKFVPIEHFPIGHFLAVIGLPLYFAGYYHIYLMLAKGNQRLASIVFCLGILAFTVGGFWITSRGFLGVIVHQEQHIPQGTFQTILDSYTLLSESLVQALRVIVLLLSLFFAAAILKGGTYYNKSVALFNPFFLLLVVFLVYYISPFVGKYIAPIAMNVAHFILFTISLYQFKHNFENENN
ncbi:MAG: DUF6796 family protein [Aureispira sp.]